VQLQKQSEIESLMKSASTSSLLGNKIKKRASLLKVVDKVETHLDVEIVLAEKQGEKLVYVLEGTKAITNKDDASICRKNGVFQFRLFKRYSKVEDFHKKL